MVSYGQKKLRFSRAKPTDFTLRPKREHPERDLQASLVYYFASVVKPGDAILFAVANGELRDIATALILTGTPKNEAAPDDAFLVPGGQGVLSGAVDLVLLSAPGVTTLIEVKVPAVPAIPGVRARRSAGTLSRQQRIFRDAALKLCHLHAVVKSIEEFDAVLRKRGVPVKAVPFPRLYGLPAGFGQE